MTVRAHIGAPNRITPNAKAPHKQICRVSDLLKYIVPLIHPQVNSGSATMGYESFDVLSTV